MELRGGKRGGVVRTLLALALLAALVGGIAQVSGAKTHKAAKHAMRSHITQADRMAAAARAAAARGHVVSKASPSRARAAIALGLGDPTSALALTPGGIPDYFGTVPNFALSPLPTLVMAGSIPVQDPITGYPTATPWPNGGIRKFIDSLPLLGPTGANTLGNFIPVGKADTAAYPASGAVPASDYYEIGLVQYTQRLHPDLPATTLRGYVQLETPWNIVHGTSAHYVLRYSYPSGPVVRNASGAQVFGYDKPSYLGPTIVCQTDRPVRIKFSNLLPLGSAGNLFIPVDTTLMGAGAGPTPATSYTENRATLHLHGGVTPWISDGTPHQWTTPANETTPYPKGVSVANVPDMPDPGPGSLTFYYTNQQSARLMFYHDHAYGLTRLNVYAGEAAGYVVRDSAEGKLINGGTIGTTVVASGTIPADEIPLVIQDKTFVPKDIQLAAQDPTWDKAKWGGEGNLWFPHVYMPNQNPSDMSGMSAVGRWDYGQWFYPPWVGVINGPVPNPLVGTTPLEGPVNPGTPTPSIVPESFMDTPVVNGAAYPYTKVGKKVYRLRILNACNDRTLNLQLYYAKSNGQMWNGTPASPTTLLNGDAGEVLMVPAAPHRGDPLWPVSWPKDGRDGGVPDPATRGPSMIQIGTEGGFLPSPVVLPNQPIDYEYFRRTITVLNITSHTLLLGPAERADVLVDFTGVPDGSKIILYSDAPAPVPAFDTRNDYYTGDDNQVSIGGAPPTAPGYGPNTRTIMQFQVDAALGTSAAVNMTALTTGIQAAYGATQPKPIVPEVAYNAAYNTTYTDTIARLTDEKLSFTSTDAGVPVTINMTEKAIIEGFDTEYGRMNAQLGHGLPNLGSIAGTAVNYLYAEAPTEMILNSAGKQIGALDDGTQIWKIDHQGVDTHAIHFHLFDIQLINRVAIDGQIFLPDANELGWKETVRMNPGQDVIVAVRAIVPTLPWKLPDSVRLINPLVPLGATFMDANLGPVTNVSANFGWEYVWHCHLLGHEENDMMRPIVFMVSPAAPSTLAAAAATSPTLRANLTWTNNWTNPAATNQRIERATNPGFTTGLTVYPAVAAGATSYSDTAVTPGATYYYRVRAESAGGYSTWTNTASAVMPAAGPPAAPSNLTGNNAVLHQITLRWIDHANNETGFVVQRARNSVFTNNLVTTNLPANTPAAPSTVTAVQTGLGAATTYYFRVRAVNGGVFSAWSNVLIIRTR